MASDHSAAELLAALMKLRGGLDSTPLGLDTPSVDQARERRRELVDQLEDYILPRLVQLDAPLLAVVGGSTGAGKSTLVNSLVGQRVTESGVLRPTTRSPILVHNPADAQWFAPERILPDLARTTSPSTDIGALRLVAADNVPAGLAILDAPDVDSVDADNRALAAQLLAAADLWLFVTSAARYADQVPWKFLQAAAERSTAVAVVLDRTWPDSISEVRVHLARMMTARGLKDSPLFSVVEGQVDSEGLLQSEAVESIRDWLADLASDVDVRAAIVEQTLDGAIRQAVFRSHDIADAVTEQVEASRQLRADIESVFSKTESEVAESTSDGTLLRGEVLARWQDFVGTGELLRSLEDRVGRIRDRVLDNLRGRRNRSLEVKQGIEHGLQLMLLEHGESAARECERGWSATQPGRTLLEQSTGSLGRASQGFTEQAERVVRDWQNNVFEMVRAEGANKRLTARFLAFGVNGLGVALMVEVFSLNAVSAGDARSSVPGDGVGRKLLEAIFGDRAVAQLVQGAHRDLVARTSALFAAEKRRYLDVLGSVETRKSTGDTIREAARALEDARHSDLLGDDPAAP